ncbi:hypothetical protein AO067_21630 [Pseudomonas viridiflava ICMP 13104]|uniref:AlgX/AlgJ SGNH hydrolase-like domain-containing protein n=2 Tax=Pseudomonas syringae group TaxID=136849 RepID=A0A0W0HD60_PSEVI|nr:hypothetical protein AO067_21630 [Pseudomonas viridiflava ICMP 13104]
MLAQNVALFSKNEAPQAITTGYVGTSRSKILQPSHLGLEDTVVGAGNTYNEITYGLILQAEILRLRFPNLKTVFVESSLLLRRPDRLIVEPDHIKYLPLLASLEPLCGDSKIASSCEPIFSGIKKLRDKHAFNWRPETPQYRNTLRLSSLLPGATKVIHAGEDQFLRGLNTRGERKDTFELVTSQDRMFPEIKNENVKVQRLRDTLSWAPWDGLFDMFALWGEAHGIQIVLFQPPVRSDLYAFQKQFGLEQHVSDLLRVSTEYKIPFIDLNKPEAGFIQNWSLFSDEDHLGTCQGSSLLMLALEDGAAQFRSTGTLTPAVDISKLNERLSRSKLCQGN